MKKSVNSTKSQSVNSTKSQSVNNSTKEKQVMKKSVNSVKSSVKSSVNNSTLKGQAMKKSVNSTKSTQSTKSVNPSIDEIRALLAALEAKQAKQASEASEASEGEGGKAPRTYEFAAIGAEFDKSRIAAVPTSERAKEYYTRQAALCMRVIAACHAPIASEIQVGKMKVKDIISLCDDWGISPMAMRVVLQLAYPIVTVCCGDTEKLAREVYDIARANSLMGSRHNTSMYTKAKDKSCALPFKRVAHNLSALGLDFSPCDSVGSCDFCDNEKDFKELVTLCDYWLDTCEKKAAKKAAKKASKASDSKAIDNDTLAKLRSLLGM